MYVQARRQFKPQYGLIVPRFPHSPHRELRSVTIWLQNKRQLIKKNAAKANSTGSPAPSLASRPSTPAASASHQSEGSSQTLTSPTPSETDIPSSSQPESRPTLERVASLSEYPTPSRPVTINDTQEAQPIWKHMPSSPLASPPRSSSTKLPNRAYNSGQVLHKVAGRPYPPITRTSSVDSAVTSVSSTSSRRKRDSERASYLKPGYTLEWACAQATKRQEDEALTGVMTEDGTVSRERIVSSHPSDLTCAHEEDSKPTEDEMQAALALCGLLQLCR